MGKTQKYNTAIFVEKAIIVHGDIFEYNKVDYKNALTKVVITCKEHGDFFQAPAAHLRGNRCPVCAGNSKKTTEQFICDSKKTHGDLYEYDQAIYSTCHSKVKIVCKKHGVFEQAAIEHINGSGCPKCFKLFDYESFVESANIKHNFKYDYTLSQTTSHGKIKIVCKDHGVFEMQPYSHIMGQGCRRCANNNYMLTTEQFVSKAIAAHGNRYDYSKVDYKGAKSKVEIICRTHGSFYQIPNTHISSQGCPYCIKKSYGELSLKNTLEQLNIVFKPQYTFDDCRDVGLLKFDCAIFLNGKICLIEYNGRQHYMPVENDFWDYDGIVRRDKIKHEFCLKHNIPLLVIKYTDKNKLFELVKDFVESNIGDVNEKKTPRE